jgi:hypothetical protein
MSTSQRAFDQVKSLLGKLDRDIDAARARRLNTGSPAPIGAVSAGVAVIGAAAHSAHPSQTIGPTTMIGLSRSGDSGTRPSHAATQSQAPGQPGRVLARRVERRPE